MKTNTLLLLTFIASFYSVETKAQTIVTNGGFEQWTVGHPDNWTSPNFLDITQTTDKNSGNYAAKFEDITSDNYAYLTITSPLGIGEHPTYASCYFKFGNFIQSDGANISISLIDANLQEVMVVTQTINTYLTSYTPIVFSFSSLTYSYIPNPVKIKIEITFMGYGIGSQFFVDDFGYGGNAQTGINNSTAKSGIEIYPNPGNGKFKLKNENSHTVNSIEICNILGEIIYTSDNLIPQIENEIDISNNPKGIYFVKIFDGEKVQTEKIVIQ